MIYVTLKVWLTMKKTTLFEPYRLGEWKAVEKSHGKVKSLERDKRSATNKMRYA